MPCGTTALSSRWMRLVIILYKMYKVQNPCYKICTKCKKCKMLIIILYKMYKVQNPCHHKICTKCSFMALSELRTCNAKSWIRSKVIILVGNLLGYYLPTYLHITTHLPIYPRNCIYETLWACFSICEAEKGGRWRGKMGGHKKVGKKAAAYSPASPRLHLFQLIFPRYDRVKRPQHILGFIYTNSHF